MGGKLDGLSIDVYRDQYAIVERWWLAGDVEPLSMLHRLGAPAVIHHEGHACGHEEYWLWGELITPGHPLWGVATGKEEPEKTEKSPHRHAKAPDIR